MSENQDTAPEQPRRRKPVRLVWPTDEIDDEEEETAEMMWLVLCSDGPVATALTQDQAEKEAEMERRRRPRDIVWVAAWPREYYKLNPARPWYFCDPEMHEA